MKRFLGFLIAVLLTTNALASQSNHVIANNNGATVRADINTSLQALASNNSGATAPSTTYANMWWYDSSTSILKKRDNANSNWVNVAYNSGTGWIPYYSGTQLGDVSILTKDTDGTLAANSDSKVATQKATKTAVDAVATTAAGKFSKTTSGEIAALTEKTALVDNDLFLINDSEASNALKKVKRINAAPIFTSQIFLSSGTFTAPSGITKVYVTMCGGGGGSGGGAANNDWATGGGGGGECVIGKPFTVTPSSGYTVTVGAAGAAGNTSGSDGTAGGTSTFDTYSVLGGSPSTGCPSSACSTNGGAGASSGPVRYSRDASASVSTATSTAGGGTFSGGNGAKGNGPSNGIGGGGGGSILGPGGAGATAGTGNSPASNSYGAGGGGSGTTSGSTARPGAAGIQGVVIVEY